MEKKKISTFVEKILVHTPLSVDIAKIIDVYTHFYIYRFGGSNNENTKNVVNSYKLNIYAPTIEERQWIPIAPMLEARDIGALVMIQNRFIYACGGVNTEYGDTNTVECYDTYTNTWKRCSSMLEPQSVLNTLNLDENLVVMYKAGLFNMIFDAYNSEENKWTMMTQKQFTETWQDCVNWKNERLYVFSDSFIHYYDIKTDTWVHTKSKLPFTRRNTKSVYVQDHIIMMGGQERRGEHLTSVDAVELYYPLSNICETAKWKLPEVHVLVHPIDTDSTFFITNEHCTKAWIFHYDTLWWEPWILPPVPYNFAAQI